MSSSKRHSRRTREDEPGLLDTNLGKSKKSKFKNPIKLLSGSKKPSYSLPAPGPEKERENHSSRAPRVELSRSHSSSMSSFHQGSSSPVHIHQGRSSPVHITQFGRASTNAERMNVATLGVGLGGGRRSLDSIDPPRNKPNHDELRYQETPRDRPEKGDDLHKIEIILIKAGWEFTNLQAPDPEIKETVEETVQRFIKQYRAVAHDLNQAQQNLAAYNQLCEENRKLQERLADSEYKLHGTNNAWLTVSSELEAKQKELFNAERNFGEKAATHEKERNSMIQEIARLKYDHEVNMGNLKNFYETRVQEARAEEARLQAANIHKMNAERRTTHEAWLAHVAQLNKGFESKLGEMEDEHEAERNQQNNKHYNEIRHGEEKLKKAIDDYHALKGKLTNDYEGRIGKLTTDHETQIGTLTDDYEVRIERLIDGYKAQISELRAEAEKEKSQQNHKIQTLENQLHEEQRRRKKELKEQKSALVQQHKDDTFQLRSNYEDAKLGLFERKHFKGLRDRDVTGQFVTIVGQVRDFANLDWDPKRWSEWPFEEDQLLEIHPQNIRKLKKQLLQNSLWILLYNFVFRSPFRILGPQGRDLDSDWVHIHTPNTSSLEWPEIPPEAEKRRYETANAFLAIMDPSVEASGNDARLKSSYEGAVANTLDALYRALSKVASLEPRHRKILENLVRLCAKTWIQFCSQPYRLIVTLPSSSGDLLSSPQRNERALTLVLSPELKRYGNSQGENLTRGEVVPDCQPAVQAYPTPR